MSWQLCRARSPERCPRGRAHRSASPEGAIPPEPGMGPTMECRTQFLIRWPRLIFLEVRGVFRISNIHSHSHSVTVTITATVPQAQPQCRSRSVAVAATVLHSRSQSECYSQSGTVMVTFAVIVSVTITSTLTDTLAFAASVTSQP